MHRTTTTALLGTVVLLAGCRDLGLSGNIPAEEARRAAPPELVVEVFAPVEEPAAQLVVDGRLWVPAGRPMALDAAGLRPVGAAAGLTVYARHWDERPYTALFVPAPVPAAEQATTARAAMEAAVDHWQEYAPVIGRAAQGAVPATPTPDPAAGAPTETQPNNSN